MQLLVDKRRRSLLFLVIALCAAAAIVPAGCRRAGPARTPPAIGRTTARLLVTRDFGSKVLIDKTVAVSGSPTVLEVLSKNAKVDTAYGGGFVNSIEGLASRYTGGGGSKNDWFYYVNGVQASVGAGEYRLKSGDRVWWDYHGWDFAPSVPAVVGQYPEPFVHGYDGKVVPTRIVYGTGFAHEAGALRDTLLGAGAKDVDFAPLRQGLPRPSDASVVLVGTWGQLGAIGWLEDAANNPGRSGLFVRFGTYPGDFFYDDRGGVNRAKAASIGAVMATGEVGSPSVIWLVTGSDSAGARRAASLVIDKPEALRGAFGLVLTDRGRDRVPVVHR